MNLDESLRWKNALSFLGLDLWQSCVSDILWSVEESAQLRNQVRAVVVELDQELFNDTDLRVAAYSAVLALRSMLSEQSFLRICCWQKEVFWNGGRDRIGEVQWDLISRALLRPTGQGFISDEMQQVLSACISDVGERDSGVQDKLSIVQRAKLSDWDRTSLFVNESTSEAAFEKVRVIARLNAFRQSWNRYCTSRGPEFLRRLFSVSEGLLDQGELGFTLSPQELVFPSSWELNCSHQRPK